MWPSVRCKTLTKSVRRIKRRQATLYAPRVIFRSVLAPLSHPPSPSLSLSSLGCASPFPRACSPVASARVTMRLTHDERVDRTNRAVVSACRIIFPIPATCTVKSATPARHRPSERRAGDARELIAMPDRPRQLFPGNPIVSLRERSR
jgi:hypothetical protein